MRCGTGAVRVAIGFLLLLALVPRAWAHASLIRAEPADGVTLAEAPAALRLTFNEPVTPLVMRLIGPGGEVSNPAVVSENTTLTLTPPSLRRGTHVLSWRVVSTDGHPVGGSLMFSVGEPSAGNSAPQIETDPAVRAALWAAKLALYVGLLFGIGGTAFSALIAGAPPSLRTCRWIVAALVLGLVAAALSLALQGLDALALPLHDVWRAQAFGAGFATSYGWTAILAAAALAFGLGTLRMSQGPLAKTLALCALAGTGLALAASGHASTAEPRLWSRPSVFVHVVCAALWVGALVPLVAIVLYGRDGGRALARFTRAIPYALVLLVASGLVLVYLQLDRPDALWTTSYGQVLSAKLMLVLALLGLGAANRYLLVPRFEAGTAQAARPLAASIRIEAVLALAILGTVALWRFTPPPRALAAGGEISIHFHGAKAMTQIEIEPVRARGAQAHIMVFDGEMVPLTVKEVTLVFSNPAAGIEPMRRDAVSEGKSNWRIDDLRIPLAGVWHLRVEILVNDFEKTVLEDEVALPRSP